MMGRVTLADTARNYLVRHHGENGLGWNLDVGMDCLYDIYDEWMADNGIASARRARSGRSHCERARAVPRAVMRALKHTKRGQMLFDTSRYVTYPGIPGGYCICANLREAFSDSVNSDYPAQL